MKARWRATTYSEERRFLTMKLKRAISSLKKFLNISLFYGWVLSDGEEEWLRKSAVGRREYTMGCTFLLISILVWNFDMEDASLKIWVVSFLSRQYLLRLLRGSRLIDNKRCQQPYRLKCGAPGRNWASLVIQAVQRCPLKRDQKHEATLKV